MTGTLADFHFLRPAWLLALVLLPVILLLMRRRRRAGGPWEQVIAPQLRRYVLDSPNGVASSGWARWLLLIGATLAVLALAGPAWRKLPQPVFRSQAALVIALDLSRSMDANDLKPSRLALARLKLLDLLHRRAEGQTALIVYAAQPFVVSPLTNDAATIAALVESLATELMPAQGSRADRAFVLAVDLLQQAGLTTGDVLLISDGADARDVAAAASLHERGLRVSVLGVGTAEGAPIPLAKGGLYTNPQGDIVVARLDEAALRDVARQGGGRYSAMRVDESDLDALLPGKDVGPGSQSVQTSLSTDLWREEGPWLLLPLAMLAALAFRRGWIGVILLVLLPLSADALDWDSLWHRNDQRGVTAMNEGNAAQAAELFDDPEWKASALYRAGRYDDSAKALAGLDSERAHYNRGNALARSGHFPEAIEAYEQALRLDPNDADARYNLDLLREQTRNPQQQQSAGNQKSGDRSRSGNGRQGQQADQDGGTGENGPSPSQPQQENGQDAQQQAQNSRDERGQQGGVNEAQDRDSDGAENALAHDQPSSNEQGKDERSETPPQGGSNTPRNEQSQDAMAEESKDQDHGSRTARAAESTPDAEEAARATEQWLRRIPDDPGGLLRRKFLYQYRQQQTPSQEEAQPW
jgi:Ca-activated chloride channel family protein